MLLVLGFSIVPDVGCWRLTLKCNPVCFQWEYAESDLLDGNPELGIKFIVHAPYEVPVINSMGYAVGPGKKAFVGFNKVKVRELTIANSV